MTYKKTKEPVREEDGMVATDDERTAEKLAKRGVNVKLTNEQEGITSSDLNNLAKEIRTVLVDALRDSGMEVSLSDIQDVSANSFSIEIEHPNENKEVYTFSITSDNKLTITSKDYLAGRVVGIGNVAIKASGEPIVNSEVTKSDLVKYFTRSTLSKEPTQVDQEIMEDHNKTGTLSIGHRDDEAGMMKQTALEIAEYGHKLFELFSHYDEMDTQVDFPHWFQSLVIRSRDYVSKASHYLEYETNNEIPHPEPERQPDQIRALYNTARDLDSRGELTLEHKQKIKKIISSYKK